MPHLLEKAASLTLLRDRTELDERFARIVFDLTQAATLSLWRVVPGRAPVTLRECVALPERALRPNDLLLAKAPREWRECCATRRPVSRDQGATTRHVFPILNDRDIVGLLDIEQEGAPGEFPHALVGGFLRVYRNHVGLLEYGDHDELTGLLNRRTYARYFGQLTNAAAVSAVIAVADIDHFKRINDQFGHTYGDELLILLARIMRASFSGQDQLFRFGGEEFLALLTLGDAAEARNVLEGWRATVEATIFPQVGRVTMSIGFTHIQPGDSGAAAFGRADEALYVAKQTGRNQVLCYEHLVADGRLTEAKADGGEMELF
jgi:diguanylate cyclase (GGDEF)-like protein